MWGPGPGAWDVPSIAPLHSVDSAWYTPMDPLALHLPLHLLCLEQMQGHCWGLEQPQPRAALPGGARGGNSALGGGCLRSWGLQRDWGCVTGAGDLEPASLHLHVLAHEMSRGFLGPNGLGCPIHHPSPGLCPGSGGWWLLC